MTQKTETITIEVTGTKKFKQKIMDVIYEALMDEDLQFKATTPPNGFALNSTIIPSEEAQP